MAGERAEESDRSGGTIIYGAGGPVFFGCGSVECHSGNHCGNVYNGAQRGGVETWTSAGWKQAQRVSQTTQTFEEGRCSGMADEMEEVLEERHCESQGEDHRQRDIEESRVFAERDSNLAGVPSTPAHDLACGAPAVTSPVVKTSLLRQRAPNDSKLLVDRFSARPPMATLRSPPSQPAFSATRRFWDQPAFQGFPPAGASALPWRSAPQPHGAPLLNVPHYAPPPHYGAVGPAGFYPPSYSAHPQAGEMLHQYGASFPDDRLPAPYHGAPASGGQYSPFHAPPPPAPHYPPYHAWPLSGGQHPQLYAHAFPQYGAPPMAARAPPAAGNHPRVSEVAKSGGSTKTPVAASQNFEAAHLGSTCDTRRSVANAVARRRESNASCDAPTIDSTAARLALTALDTNSIAGDLGNVQPPSKSPSSQWSSSKMQQQQQDSVPKQVYQKYPPELTSAPPHRAPSFDDVPQLSQPAQRQTRSLSSSSPPPHDVTADTEPPAADDDMVCATSAEDGPAQLPTITSIKIEGKLEEGETLLGMYTYAGGQEGASRVAWYQHENEDDLGTIIPGSEGHRSHVLARYDIAYRVSFCCTPVRADGVEGITELAMSPTVIAPRPLRLAGLSLRGTPMEGAKLLAKHHIPKDEEAQEDHRHFFMEMTYQWYRSKRGNHSSFTMLPKATARAYRLSFEDVGCILICEARAQNVFGRLSEAVYEVSAQVDRAPSALRDEQLKSREALEVLPGSGQARLDPQLLPNNPSQNNPQPGHGIDASRRGSALQKRTRENESGNEGSAAKRAHRERSKDGVADDQMDDPSAPRGRARAAKGSDGEGHSGKVLGSDDGAAQEEGDEESSDHDDGNSSAATEYTVGGSVLFIPGPDYDFSCSPPSSPFKPRNQGSCDAMDAIFNSYIATQYRTLTPSERDDSLQDAEDFWSEYPEDPPNNLRKMLEGIKSEREYDTMMREAAAEEAAARLLARRQEAQKETGVKRGGEQAGGEKGEGTAEVQKGDATARVLKGEERARVERKEEAARVEGGDQTARVDRGEAKTQMERREAEASMEREQGKARIEETDDKKGSGQAAAVRGANKMVAPKSSKAPKAISKNVWR